MIVVVLRGADWSAGEGRWEIGVVSGWSGGDAIGMKRESGEGIL